MRRHIDAAVVCESFLSLDIQVHISRRGYVIEVERARELVVSELGDRLRHFLGR